MRNQKSKILYSLFYPLLFVAILWGIRLFEEVSGYKLFWYGLYPRTIHGLIGIATAPLIHGDFSHLLSNTLPLIILGSMMFYFYRPIAFQVFFWVYLMTGIWVWAAARDSYHIGASGILYGFLCFLFFSGIFRKNPQLMALSLFVTVLYGSMVWGIFPIKSGVSWESHLLGSLAGIITAYNFRKEGPPPKQYNWGSDEENELIDVSGEQLDEAQNHPQDTIDINYTFKPKS
jgi:membrane associated rhomboid family serine protease